MGLGWGRERCSNRAGKAKRVEIENVHSGRGSTLLEPRNGENKGTSLQLRRGVV